MFIGDSKLIQFQQKRAIEEQDTPTFALVRREPSLEADLVAPPLVVLPFDVPDEEIDRELIEKELAALCKFSLMIINLLFYLTFCHKRHLTHPQTKTSNTHDLTVLPTTLSVVATVI